MWQTLDPFNLAYHNSVWARNEAHVYLSRNDGAKAKLYDAEGLTNPQIASRLYLSPCTIGQHLRSIYRTLGVHSRAASASEALERGLI